MRKGQFVSRLILVGALIIASVVVLYPTFKLSSLNSEKEALVDRVAEITSIDEADIKTALRRGTLESLIRERAVEGEEEALNLAGDLIALNGKVEDVKLNALKQGLDLQGGTYLVYEADLPELLMNVAKSPDQQLDDIIAATRNQVDTEGDDFFVALRQNFEARDIRLSRYFGRKGETADDIIVDLKAEAEDAIDRTLEVLRNRIDQFGVSEPSIVKQGDRRIEIELAGVQDIQQAKNIIGQTALLEFKLVKEADLVVSVIDDIDRVMRQRQGQQVDTDTLAAETDTATVDTAGEAEETEVSLSDLFGDSDESDAAEDETISVDENTFSERPFSSLLRQLQGLNFIAIPPENMNAVRRVLQLPEVQQVIPNDAQFHFGREPMVYGDQQYERLYLLKREADLLGRTLTDAQVVLSGGGNTLSAGQPQVNLELNSEGAKTFARLTGMNIGRQLAIVLDGKVASAPNINSKIPNGRAVIEGQFTMDEAQQLALVLRSGALPAPVYAITENTVGPSLGQDSIEKGTMSVVIGLILVIIFMVIYYRASGLVADFALLLNILFVFAVLAGFHATLTLPGIAGIILTVGMAVDANVLIFERIREELRGGKTVRSAIDAGYGRAFTTILDANVTTLITAIVLYSFGTGPVRGFALTLSIGILASMFTAIVVTRLVFEMVTTRYAVKKMSI